MDATGRCHWWMPLVDATGGCHWWMPLVDVTGGCHALHINVNCAPSFFLAFMSMTYVTGDFFSMISDHTTV